jgi:heptosyltransferase-2
MDILMISLAGIGDTIMATPALKALRDRFPDARLDVLVMQKASRDLLSSNPHVDEVLYWDFLGRRPLESLAYVLGLRRRRYDVTVNAYPANRWEYNVVNCLAGGRRRLGHRYRHLDWANAGFLLTSRLTEDDSLHNVEENLRLVDLLTPGRGLSAGPKKLVVRIPAGSHLRAEQWLREKGLGTGFLVGLHPGCGLLKNHEHRRWPAERFGGLGRRLADALGAEVLVFGGPDEAELKERVVTTAGPHAHPVALPGLLDSAALLARCRFLVSNDSSLMHLAAALQVPVVAIFGPTNATWVRPYNAPHVVVSRQLDCSPCFYYSPRPLRCSAGRGFACIGLIAVDDVMAAVKRLLSVKEKAPGRRVQVPAA